MLLLIDRDESTAIASAPEIPMASRPIDTTVSINVTPRRDCLRFI
jgi:hypothetical protein